MGDTFSKHIPLEAQRDLWKMRARRAEAAWKLAEVERDSLQRAVDAVKALADEFQSHHEQPMHTGDYSADIGMAAAWREAEGRLRATLDRCPEVGG